MSNIKNRLLSYYTNQIVEALRPLVKPELINDAAELAEETVSFVDNAKKVGIGFKYSSKQRFPNTVRIDLVPINSRHPVNLHKFEKLLKAQGWRINPNQFPIIDGKVDYEEGVDLGDYSPTTYTYVANKAKLKLYYSYTLNSASNPLTENHYLFIRNEDKRKR